MDGNAYRMKVWLLLAAALFMRVLVPTGWMPDTSQPGFALMPCEGVVAQPQQTHHAMDMHGEPETSGDHAGAPCIFAGFGSAAPLAGDIALPQAIRIAELAPVPLPPAWRIDAPVRLRPPGRAPPAGA